LSQGELHMHYVCTRDEALELVKGRERFFVYDCGCRTAKGGCTRSRSDVCLFFAGGDGTGESAPKEIAKADVDEIFREADEKKLVARPFRNKERTETDGICFCCDDCCGYFLNAEEEHCDKGALIEETSYFDCTDCGDCIPICHFGARRIDDGALEVNRDKCFGCGLCAQVCPEDCIDLVPRG